MRSLLPSILAAILALFFVQTTGYRDTFINEIPFMDTLAIAAAFISAISAWRGVKVGLSLVQYMSRALSINFFSMAILSAVISVFRIYDFFIEQGYVDLATMIEDFALFFAKNIMLMGQSHMFIGYFMASGLCAILALYMFRPYSDEIE